MDHEGKDLLFAELHALRSELSRMSGRIAELEGLVPPGTVAAAGTPAPLVAPPAQIPEEVVLAISAAVAAFLGVRARLRHVRLLTSPAWAQQGRVTVQASRTLAR
jgi:methylmalonyl-CoA carboxyltransferase large subunit